MANTKNDISSFSPAEGGQATAPALRFPGFTEPWEMPTIESVFEIRNGYTPSKSEKSFWEEGTIPWFRMEDIRDNGGILGEAIQHITPSAVKGTGLFKPYSIILATTATIGVHAMLVANSLANQRFTNFLVRESQIHKYDPYFNYFSFFKIDKWCQKNTNAGGLLSVDISGLRKQKFPTPSIKEQKKIADFLSLIDERIATQERIIDKLKSIILGIAQSIISRNSPNICISECLNCGSSTLQESDVLDHGVYPVYGANGIVGYLDNYSTQNEAIYIIKDGSGVGTVSYVPGKCSATGTLNILQARSGYSLKYLYYLLKAFNFEPYKTGMAIPHIYFKDYGKAKIFCPSYSEQLRYANLLSAIDSKLSAEQKILTKLCMQKQYLLCQMFI